MTASVISLKGDEIYAKGVPQPDLVAMLEEILALAQRGEIHGAHMVIVHDDGVARKACAGRANYAAVGCLAALSARLIADGIDNK